MDEIHNAHSRRRVGGTEAGHSLPDSVPSLGALPDSGQRVSFGEGLAIREAADEKAAMEGISPYALERLGTLLTNGGKKYGDFRNWEKGMPWTRCIGAILRHTAAYMRRDQSEDHLAAIMWNAMALIHYETVGDRALDDRPVWEDDTHD